MSVRASMPSTLSAGIASPAWPLMIWCRAAHGSWRAPRPKGGAVMTLAPVSPWQVAQTVA